MDDNEKENEAIDKVLSIEVEFAAYKEMLTVYPDNKMFECHLPNEIHRYHFVDKGRIFAIIMDENRVFQKFVRHLTFH